MKQLTKSSLLLLAIFSLTVLPGCFGNGDGEEPMQEQMQDTTEDVQDKAEDLGDAAEDEAEEVQDEAEETQEEMTE